mgnify:CR=1 FL=1
MQLTLGPVLFGWQRQQLLDFYAEMASQPLDVIYLGETVCSKRRALSLGVSQDIGPATLGVRLGPDDVAATVWRLATAPASSLPVHSCVGWQTRLFALLSKLSPGFMNRLVTARMAGY